MTQRGPEYELIGSAHGNKAGKGAMAEGYCVVQGAPRAVRINAGKVYDSQWNNKLFETG